MTAPLIPQEIYLLERYSSLEYFGRLRDHFAAMVRAADEALAEFMKKLPADYRSRPLHEQPDAVWGERVLPNLRWTLDGLNSGYVRISRGDLGALSLAGNVETAFAAITRDYSSSWMVEESQATFRQERYEASERASNISITTLADWCAGDLTSSYAEHDRGPLMAPSKWPSYRLNQSVQVRTDAKVPRDGVYLPDANLAAAQFLIEGHEAWGAAILRNPHDPDDQSFSRVPTRWTLVERVPDAEVGVSRRASSIDAGTRLRCEAGQPCPREGHWFTPAQPGSRRWFGVGETMPEIVGNSYGLTIWQWDVQQPSV